MKHKTTSILFAAFFGVLTAHAQLTIPSDGSDGAFNPATNVEIDLGLATTALWTAPGSGNGVYDAEKWAVVFKYSSVNIPAGVKVTFKNHPTYAPVVWLVQGNVTIDGELNLDGKNKNANQPESLTPTEPGPGGFRGGASGPAGFGIGLGTGGGLGADGSGAYQGQYGNPQILPLIGGSGGNSGGGGGGCIAIFASQSVSVGGLISAKGGVGFLSHPFQNPINFGSGGAIKIVASAVTGAGTVSSLYPGTVVPGRIRIETNSLAPSLVTAPETIGVPPASTPIIWPAANTPIAKVISVDAVNAPADPRAQLVAGADVAIQDSNQVDILIETQNFPIEGVVQLFIKPKFGNSSKLTATRLNGDITSATWRVQTTLPQGFVTLQARATQP